MDKKENEIVRLILVNFKNLKGTLLRMIEKEKEIAMKRFFKAIQEYSIKWDKYEPNETRVYKKAKKLLHNYEKELHIKEEEEQVKKEQEIQNKREKLGELILDIVERIGRSFKQYNMGLYREHIYNNILYMVENLRNTVKSLAEIDLTSSEYEEILSAENFDLERFLSTKPEIYRNKIYERSSYYDPIWSDIAHLLWTYLGRLFPKHRKEEYLCAFELINRIEEDYAKELIKAYNNWIISKRIVEIRLPSKPKPKILKCIKCGWKTIENINLCERCGEELEN